MAFENVKLIEQVQRFNCQNLAHIGINCTIVYRCVKYTESHPRERGGGMHWTSKLWNAALLQCSQAGHPASCRRCPAYKEIVARREAAKNRKTTEVFRVKRTVTQLSQSLTNPGVFYAQLGRSGCSTNSQSTHQRFPWISWSAFFSPPPTSSVTSLLWN